MLEAPELSEEALVPTVPEDCGRPACFAPWRENPYGLVSLWDMLRFYAEHFCRASSLLGQMISNVQHGIIPTNSSWGIIGGELGLLEKHCDQMGLAITGSQIKRIKNVVLGSNVTPGISYVGQMLLEVQTRLVDELESRTFLSVESNRVRYYEPSEALFGLEVDGRFPSTAYDIAEAGKCYALYRPTACVFHLMRVLEIGLRVFADRFAVPSDRQNWHNIIEGIEKAVRNIGNDPNRPIRLEEPAGVFLRCRHTIHVFQGCLAELRHARSG